jgi:hypothetical protein
MALKDYNTKALHCSAKMGKHWRASIAAARLASTVIEFQQ